MMCLGTHPSPAWSWPLACWLGPGGLVIKFQACAWLIAGTCCCFSPLRGISSLWLVAGLQLQRANLQPGMGSYPAGPQNWPGVKAALRAACGSKAETLPFPVPLALEAAFSRWVWCLAGRGLLRVLAALFCFQIAFLEINTNICQGTMDELFFVKTHSPFFLECLRNVKRSFPVS